MLYDPSTNSALHAWLVKTLEPICDAEPEALATYIVALLKHEGPENELRDEVTRQLNEFFENGATSFVDTLFATLRSKSYIPYTASPTVYSSKSGESADAGIPIPLDALIGPSVSPAPDRGTKRSLDSDAPDSRGQPKGPRLSNEGDRWHQNGSFERRRDDYNMNGGQMGGNAIQAYQTSNGRPMLPKGVCRDYHLKGFCSRGALCKFSHDDIGFAPQTSMAMNGGGMPFMNMYGAVPFGMLPGQSSTYDPNDARMDMGAFSRSSSLPRGRNGMDNGSIYNPHGELPVVQDLTPSVQGEEASQANVTGMSVPGSSSIGSLSDAQAHASSIPPGTNGSPHFEHPHTASQSHSGGRPTRGGNINFRGRGRGAHGTFGGSHQSFSEELENGRSTKTIVVEKIPDEHLSLEAVNGWFKRFGTVTNVAVDAKGKKALVSFSTREEARAAWAAEEAVFNNRFVKIFWHRPMEGQGAAGARALQASASLVANMGTREKEHTSPLTHPTKRAITPSVSVSTPTSSAAPSSLSALQSKEELLAKQITEQKDLMGKLSTSSGEEKKQIMARLRALNAEMKAPSKQSSHGDESRQSSQGPADKERKRRELLDMELDIHSKGAGEETPADDEETTEQLREKLAKLRAEASALGITDTLLPTHAPSYRASFRGRGRGRAFYRGGMRGGPPRGSMKLDNRTKTLLVKGLSSRDAEVVQAVRSWFEANGQLSSLDVHDDESLLAAFQTRPAAEQAFSMGPNITSIGEVKLSWYNETASAKIPPSSQAISSEKKVVDDSPLSPRPEEVTEEAGWGNEEDMGRF